MIKATKYTGGVSLIRYDGTVVLLSDEEARAIAELYGSGPTATRSADDHLARHRELTLPRGRELTFPTGHVVTYVAAGGGGGSGGRPGDGG